MARTKALLPQEHAHRTCDLILVTLGTHTQPMDRLLVELDRLVEVGTIDEEVVVQAPATRLQPRHLTMRSVVSHTELEHLVKSARLVVTHAGPGNLALIARAGKVAVVVPRDERVGEHVDDHQRRYAAKIRSEPGYVVVEDIGALAAALEAAITTTAGRPRTASATAIATIRSLIEACDQ